MRRILLLVLLLLAPIGPIRAEHLILTGGPALRQWEDLRVKRDQHDRWWANFIRASTLRMAEIRKAYGKDAPIVWFVHRDGYRTRGREDGKPYTSWITDLARKRNVNLQWFDSTTELINLFNRRPRRSIETFDYFGHSNKYCFMLDYGNDIMAASTVWLHENDLGRVNRSIFADSAYCKSWGCHTAESMSAVWRKRFGIALEGARGATDYRVVGQGRLPTVNGSWAR